MLKVQKRQKFKDFLVENPNFWEDFNVDIDPATKDIVNEWFKFRYLGDTDPEIFAVYLARQARQYIGQYKKNLILESTEVDWFVSSYSEELRINKTANNAKGSIIISTQGKTTGQRDSTRKPTLTYTETEESTYKKTGTVGVEGSNTENDTQNSTNTTTKTGTVKTSGTNTGTIENEGNGTRLDVNSGTDTTTNTGTTKTSGTNSTTKDATADNLASELPMSIEYNTGAGVFPSLNWQTASGQSSAKTHETDTDINSTETTQNSTNTLKRDTQVNTTTTSSGTQTQNLKNSITQTNDLEDVSTVEGGSNKTGTNSQTTTNDLTDTNNVTRTRGETGTDTTNENTSSTNTVNQTQSNTQDAETESEDKSIISGRSGVLSSTILKEARNYIRETSAIKWFISKLEPCFYAFYDLQCERGEYYEY